jgi:hypothetical protein
MDEKRGKGIPFAKGSETSADAADSMEKPALRLRSKVRLYLYSCDAEGATDEQIQLALNMAPNTQRPRRLELERMGAIRKLYVDGKHVKRTTTSGRKAGVYVHTLFDTELPPVPEHEIRKAVDPRTRCGTIPPTEVSMPRKCLIERLDSLVFRATVFADELRSEAQAYDSTEVISSEMKLIIEHFTAVVNAGRNLYKEVDQSEKQVH